MSEESTTLVTLAADVGVAHTRWWNALLAGDTAVLDTLLADDWTLHNPYGGIGTKTDYVGAIRSGQAKYDDIKDEVLLIRIHGQTGIVTGRADIQYQWDGQATQARIIYTAVYGYTAPHWHMLAWQATLSADSKS
jgi:uncharacterized protein DUF4440